MVIETSVQHFLFFPGRSISSHPWGEMVSGIGRDGLGVHLAPWKCMEIYDQYCAMCDIQGNCLNNGDRSMYAGILCTDIRELFFSNSRVNNFYFNIIVNSGEQGRFKPNFHIIQHYFAI